MQPLHHGWTRVLRPSLAARPLLAGTLAALLAGCTVGPKYETQAVPLIDTFKHAYPVDT
jgi:hypothetical protein